MTGLANRQEQLDDLVRQLRSEAPLPPTLAAARNGDMFNQGIAEALKQLPLLQRLLVQRTHDLAWKGLLAARNRKLATARLLLEQAGSVCLGLASQTLATAHCRSRLAAAVAYLHYCHGRFEEVRGVLEQANAADLVLMDHGSGLCHAHRVQLIHNLARSEAQRGRADHGVQVADRLVEHLFGEDVDLPLPGPWDQQSVDARPLELAAVMVHQVDVERQRWRSGA